ncbi:hypothetical protein, partial [Streptomyces spongiae]|uniref:hypothetical protein n=1 Tax=Streptomyces spongiae TaxID=565072 RepID=UPI001D15A6FF
SWGGAGSPEYWRVGCALSRPGRGPLASIVVRRAGDRDLLVLVPIPARRHVVVRGRVGPALYGSYRLRGPYGPYGFPESCAGVR